MKDGFADLVTFTEEIVNGKPFLYSVKVFLNALSPTMSMNSENCNVARISSIPKIDNPTELITKLHLE